MIRLIAADMDGTLLDSRKRLPEGFFNVLEKLKSEHIHFAVASGRQYYNLLKFFPSADELFFLSENGAVIFEGRKNIFISEIAENSLPEIVNAIRETDGVYPVVCGLDSAYIEDTEPFFLRNAEMYYERLEIVPDVLSAAKKDRICKIAAFDARRAEEYTYPLMKKFSGEFMVSLSGQMWVDLMNHGINKGTGIRFLQKRLHVAENETMAFGDYLNDCQMMQACGFSFAMANAHPELKKICSRQTDSNDENGVLNAINKFFHFS